MARLREFLQKNPIAGYALAGLVIVLAAYMISTQLLRGPAPLPPGEAQPSPSAPAAPVPAPPAAAPVPSPESSVSASVVPSAPTGRSDPFIPLVSPPTSAPSTPRPPATQLPPPPFPVPGTPLPPPPLPGAPGVPAPAPSPAPVPPSPSEGVSVSGIVSDASKVVIVSIGGRTEILFEGESAGDLRVVKIDANRRTVTFERAGQRFDVTMGGG